MFEFYFLPNSVLKLFPLVKAKVCVCYFMKSGDGQREEVLTQFIELKTMTGSVVVMWLVLWCRKYQGNRVVHP